MNPISSTTQMPPWSDIRLLVEGEFPLLAEVARRIFCISASCAQSERDISAVSRTITDARSRLTPKTVEAMELIRWAVRGSVLNMDD